jgi:hypothetical protein
VDGEDEDTEYDQENGKEHDDVEFDVFAGAQRELAGEGAGENDDGAAEEDGRDCDI